jgi:hypothetical protein
MTLIRFFDHRRRDATVRRTLRARGGMALLATLALLGMGGCRDLGVAPELSVPSSILLDRDLIRMASLGETAPVRATVLDQFGRELSGISLIWYVEDPAVATLEADNRIQARRNGQTTVRVVVDVSRSRAVPSGYRSGAPTALARIEVRQEVGSLEFTPGAATLFAVGQSRQMSVMVRDPLGTPFERAWAVTRWESTNEGVVRVTPEGRVLAVEDGSAQVRAVLDDGAQGTASVQVTTRFTFDACVSSGASRLAANLGTAPPPNRCASAPMRAFAAEPPPSMEAPNPTPER